MIYISLVGHIFVHLTSFAGIHLTLLGRAKVHWSEGSQKNRRHYRSEEVYFNDRLIAVGSGMLLFTYKLYVFINSCVLYCGY